MILPEDKKPLETGFWKPELDADARLAGETARHLALRWVVRLRYGLIAGEVALIAALSFGLQISLPVTVIGPAIGIQVLSNWLLGSRMGRLGGNAEHLVGALFSLDTLPPHRPLLRWWYLKPAFRVCVWSMGARNRPASST